MELIRRIDAAGDLYLAKHEGWYCSPCERLLHREGARGGPEVPGARRRGRMEVGRERLLPPVEVPAAAARLDRQPSRGDPPRDDDETKFDRSSNRACATSRSRAPASTGGSRFPGYPGHTVYVWLDALANYITASALEQEARTRGTVGSRRVGGRRRATWALPTQESPSLRHPPLPSFLERFERLRRRADPPSPHRQGHPPLPRRLLAGVPDVGRTAAADDGLGARLVAARREEDVEVGRQRRPARRPRRRASVPTRCATSCCARWSSGRTRASPTRRSSIASTATSRTTSATPRAAS